ncbi:MAG: glycoside hydrolase [Firmicutes bacterium]|nr:glycoside hydrolase [Alicyclobacillaceae bacterium]MCL6496800.1 glycoside hydrolase [Bacillota bacterium]
MPASPPARALLPSGSVAGPHLKVIAFYDQNQESVPPNPLALLAAHPGLVNYLAPFWYEVGANGHLVAKPQGDVAALARAQHLPLLPLINNAGGTDAFLHTAALRRTAVQQIVSLIRRDHYAGVNIDFQLLKPGDRSDLNAFMAALHGAMPPGTLLSVSVMPPASRNGSMAAYDYRTLAEDSGAVVLMAYDHHGDGTPPGPVSPYAWVASGIRRVIADGVPPSKIYLGIANYGYEWTDGSTHATTIPLKAMHQHLYGRYRWDPASQEAYDRWTTRGISHVIWFVNDRAAVARIRLAERDHLGGVAFWRIGYEDAKWWNAVAQALQQTRHRGAPIRPKAK